MGSPFLKSFVISHSFHQLKGAEGKDSDLGVGSVGNSESSGTSDKIRKFYVVIRYFIELNDIIRPDTSGS